MESHFSEITNQRNGAVFFAVRIVPLGRNHRNCRTFDFAEDLFAEVPSKQEAVSDSTFSLSARNSFTPSDIHDGTSNLLPEDVLTTRAGPLYRIPSRLRG